jgi:hypothetical protein
MPTEADTCRKFVVPMLNNIRLTGCRHAWLAFLQFQDDACRRYRLLALEWRRLVEERVLVLGNLGKRRNALAPVKPTTGATAGRRTRFGESWAERSRC